MHTADDTGQKTDGNLQETSDAGGGERGGTCGTCAHCHALAGYPSLWCEHLKKWTAPEARSCGGWELPSARVTVDITADGYTLTCFDGKQTHTETWRHEHGRPSQIAGNIEEAMLDEDLTFALLCLSSEAEHAMKVMAHNDVMSSCPAPAGEPDKAA